MDTSVVYAMVVIALLSFASRSLAVAASACGRQPSHRGRRPQIPRRQREAALGDRERAGDFQPIDEKEDHF